ncbi:VanW family protein [Bacillus weihaiensis]|uniref:G5 domain-containing protein n=1 Tax=Bacillus weihaiensis TaxID=1547283 RepID=A0A1L3MPD8_9BACI|nr:VanW family protein [Bacillus weihaiensis]APH04218.1 hypothetical protein A9C19_05385 [Bacillus weihaiensis]
MKINNGVKAFVVLLISTVYLIAFSQIGARAYDFMAGGGTFQPGTKIGSVTVENMTVEQAVEEVSKQVDQWFLGDYLQVSINDQNVVIGQDFFFIDIQKTVQDVLEGKSDSLSVEINKDVYDLLVKEELGDSYSTIDHEQLQQVLVDAVKAMANEQQYYVIQAFVKQELNTIAAETTITREFDQELLQKVINQIGTIHVPAQSQISVVELLGSHAEPNTPEINSVTSALYKTLLLTNFEIVERHTSLELPNEVELGYEASVIAGKSDLKWFNPNPSDYTISFTVTNNSFIVTVHGAPFLYTYDLKLSEQETYPPKQIKRYTSLLGEKEEKVVQDGKNGLFVKVSRIVKDLEGALLETEEIAEDFYPPVHKIIETGLLNPVTNSDTTPSESIIVEEGESVEESTTTERESESTNNEDQAVNESQDQQKTQDKQDGMWEKPTEQDVK